MRIYFSEILVLALFHPHFLRDLLGKSTQIQPGLALGLPWVSLRSYSVAGKDATYRRG
jgi:hypothetical protein